MNLDKATGVLKVIGEIVLFIGGLGYMISYFLQGRDKYDQQAIAALNATVAGLKAQNDYLKEENVRLRKALETQAEKHARLEGDMKAIRALAQGTPAINEFSHKFDEVIKEFKRDIKAFKAGQEEIIQMLQKNKLTEEKEINV